MSQVKSFEELECWKACTELRRLIINLLKKFPADEKYDLISQTRRAARSLQIILQKDMEDFILKKTPNFVGKVAVPFELKDHIIIALDEKYISIDDYNHFTSLYGKALLILNGYINYLIKSSVGTVNN